MPETKKKLPSSRSSKKSDWPPLDQLGFWNIAEQHPDRLALILPDGSSRTFGELHAAANRLAHGFRALGLKTGDCVAALLSNDASYYEALLATSQSGLYLCALNHHLTGAEIAYVLSDSEAKVFIADQRFAESALRAVESSSTLALTHCFGLGPIEGFTPLEDLTKSQPSTPPDDRRAGSMMPYTSGTTGKPKGVRRPLPEGDPTKIAAAGTIFARAFKLRPLEGVQLVVGPLYHAGPFAFSWGSLNVGHTQVVTDRFDPEKTLAAIERYRVTNTHLVATMFHRLLSLPESIRSKYDLSSLHMVVHSASPTPPEVKQQMMDWWGPVIWETYGGTEGAATIASPEQWLARPGTVGYPVKGVSVTIRDEDGNACPTGTPGAVFIEHGGPRFSYWKDDEKTQSAYQGNAFTLGDVGYLDEEGYLFLTGRASEVIISGGVNIYPAEVENTLLAHPAVADLAVLGVPDPEWGERVIAVIQPRDAAADDALADELIAFCRERIAHYKCPREIHFRQDLPREENGKLYRRRLREEFWTDSGRSI
jgi:long-chain acyl-CoA synthetase